MFIYYNNDIKGIFIDDMLADNVSYVNLYEGLFKTTLSYEELHGKDLCLFSKKDLLVMFKNLAPNMKYSSIMTYNSLISKYKKYVAQKGIKVIDEVCSVKELKLIKNYKQYIVLNDEEIDLITKYLDMDGADYNPVLAIRILWEIDGQESIEDILKLKISDMNKEKRTITIYGTDSLSVGNNGKREKVVIGRTPHEYKISDWLFNALCEYADMDYLEFKNKNGRYKMMKAINNDGYIFRTTYTARTKIGEPLDTIRFSNILYQFSERNLTELVSVQDIMMSLALKYMIINKKTHAQMYTQRRYFANLASYVYADVFNQYAEEKYPELFSNYVNYYDNLSAQHC